MLIYFITLFFSFLFFKILQLILLAKILRVLLGKNTETIQAELMTLPPVLTLVVSCGVRTKPLLDHNASAINIQSTNTKTLKDDSYHSLWTHLHSRRTHLFHPHARNYFLISNSTKEPNIHLNVHLTTQGSQNTPLNTVVIDI